MDNFTDPQRTPAFAASPADAVPGHRHGPRPPAAGYLPVLMQMFPGRAWLTVPQIAACLRLSTGHIYNLCSSGRMPFRVVKNQSGRLRASVRDIAAYMEAQHRLSLSGQRPTRGPRARWLKHPTPQ